MELRDKLLKFKDTGKRGSLESAQYILTYRPDRGPAGPARTSHAILSSLKADGDLVLELNSNLFCNSDRPKDSLVFECLETAKKLGLEHSYRKLPPPGSSTIFERLLNLPKENGHELLVLITGEVWKNEDILNLILPYGARYYMAPGLSGDCGPLASFGGMTDMDRLKHFRLIVFDMALLGHMGINSASMGPDEVKAMLGI